MPGRIEKCNRTALIDRLIGRDMLCNAACFTTYNFGIEDRVEQAGLPMIHVSHDGNDGRTLGGLFAQCPLFASNGRFQTIFFLLKLDAEAELIDNSLGSFEIKIGRAS